MRANSFLLLIALLLLKASHSMAQESMMSEVSNVYLEKLIATAKENYPRMRSMQGQINIAKSNLTAQKSTWFDGLSFSYIYQPNNTLNIVNPTFFDGYQVAISFSVTSLFQKASSVKQAKEAVKLAQYSQEEYNLTIETQVKSLYYAYMQQLLTLRLQTKLYADAQSMNKDVNSKYAKGEATFAEYLQAQGVLTAAMQSKIAAEAGYLSAKAALEELLTKKLEEIQ